METLWQDLRYSFRMLLKNPGFTAVAVLTLALGIGANTAIFSVVNTVLLRPLPYPDSDRLVQVWTTNPRANRWGDWVSYPNFVDWQRENRVFEAMAAYRSWLFNITGGDHPEVLRGLIVSSRLFSVLRVEPVLGRAFLPEEDQPGRNRVAIVSFGLWQRRFGSDPGLVGKTVMIDSQPHLVVGVMPRGFNFPPTLSSAAHTPDVWVPLGPDPSQEDRSSYNYRAVARLKPGVTIEQAQDNMEATARGLAEQYPANRDMGVKVAGPQENVAKEVRPALLILLGAIGLVLLIACANVASLLLARATARRRETAIRQALGASRRRLIRQLLTESILLAGLGGAAGLLLAVWGVASLVQWSPNIPRLYETIIDLRVLGFTLLLSLTTGVIFGIAPAVQGSRIGLHEALKESGTRATAGLGHGRTRSVLVVGEMALALMLLIGAGLLIRSFLNLAEVDPGFNPYKVLTGLIMLPPSKYAEPRRQAAFFKEIIDRMEAVPGVEAAGGATSVPLTENDSGPIRIEGRPAPRPGDPVIHAERPKITPDYLRAMGIRLLRGRAFTWADNESSPEVAIISESAAQRYWPNEDPIGQRLSINSRNGQPVWRQVVGIVKDVRHDSLEKQARPAVYVPLLQVPLPFIVLAVRAHGEPSGLAAAIRREVMAVGRDQPVFAIQTMERRLSNSVSHRRFQMLLLTVFAAMALALAAIGVYGVMAYSVAQRTHEIGIRMALGAQAGDVLRLVVGQGVILILAGVVIGLAAALALTRVLSGLLYGVSATDPATFATNSLVLVAVALLASYLPARRATKVDPMVALRYE